ncbi:uncharacterized protein LOC102558987 [Alligator mississippiensis]|uniref:uncharacterized protein LOC102558987 n=1 Tax=Alligator mississippiensis TaxID=8496 RepID=UPI002877673D|nr:uncharacterized protein LOC102558987 [Alligator mississippiensis]
MAAVLGYWDIRGLAHAIRLLLEYTGTTYEDKLYSCGEGKCCRARAGGAWAASGEPEALWGAVVSAIDGTSFRDQQDGFLFIPCRTPVS